MKQDPLFGKQVLVLGFGLQGQALARWLPTVGANVTVNDRRTAAEVSYDEWKYLHVDFVFGSHPLELLDKVDVVCVSGGVPLSLPLIQAAIERDKPLVNDAQLFLERCSAPVVGITGSAGKTTTTSLVADVVQQAGYKTWVGGNIGNVLLDDLPNIQADDCVVMELSSFQLELMKCSPQVAVILNITPNHLDRHGNMDNYVNAKVNILRHQKPTDVAILSKDDPITRSLEVLVEGELAWFSQYEMVPDGAFLAGKRIMVAGAASHDYIPHIVCEKEAIPLRGDHNVANVLAACAVGGTLGLATDRPGISVESMRDAITSFQPVPHRLEIVRNHQDVTYVNDSIATAPERLQAALQSFTEPLILLLGGADKDLSWENALQLALRQSRHLIVFGAEGEKQVRTKVQKLLTLWNVDPSQYSLVDDLDAATELAAQIAQAGDIVLLSPGGTSYDAYPNFAKRGEHFRDLVTAL